MTRTVAVQLICDEALWLYQAVRQTDRGTDEQPVASVYPLILALASAVAELARDGNRHDGAVSLTLTEPEVWLLRERVSVFDKTADVAFGLKLQLKLIAALQAFDAPFQADAVEEDCADVTLTEAQREALRVLANGEHDGAS